MSPSIQFVLEHVGNVEAPRILEIGTRKWGDKSTHHKNLFPHAAEYVMADVMEGEDVDEVCDVHNLGAYFLRDYFDCVWLSSVFEHLEKPWVAIEQIYDVLKFGGVVFVQTHQTFPIHGYPDDYWRFTKNSLEVLCERFRQKLSHYEFPCKIMSEEVPRTEHGSAYLNVCIAAMK